MDAPRNNNTLLIVLLVLVFVSGSGCSAVGGVLYSSFRRFSKPVRPGDGRRPRPSDKSARRSRLPPPVSGAAIRRCRFGA